MPVTWGGSVFPSGGSSTPGGSSGEVQFNNGGALGGALGSSVTPATGAITLTSQGAAVTPLTIVPHAGQTAPLILFGTDTGLARASAGLLKVTSGGSNLGSIQAGNYTATALATPAITPPLTVNGTPGATTYGYKAVAFLNDGTSSAASAEVTIATGPAVLDGTDNITVATPAVANMAYYNLYRTTGGAAPPKLIYSGTTPSYIDTGTEISASTPPTTNTTGRILVGAGGVSTPSLALGSTPTTGIYWPSATNMTMVVGGSSVFSYGTVLHQMAHDVGLGWSANPVWALADTLLTSPAAATLTVGNKPSATPVANTLIIGESGSGTDIAGANGIIQSGNGTGTGGSGALKTKTAYPAAATGSTANTYTDRSMLAPKWSTLTESSATAIATITFGASSAVGAEFLVTVESNDGTDYQSLTSRVRVSSVRKAAGNTVSAVTLVGTDTLAESTGTSTLTAAYTVTEGAGAVTLLANAVSSLTQTTLRATWQAVANGPGVTLAQP